MKTNLPKKFVLIAGDGNLPVKVIKAAREKDIEVVVISLFSSNRREINKWATKVYTQGIGELKKVLKTVKSEGITDVTYIGKIHKGLLLLNPYMDSLARNLMKQASKLNDDEIMLMVTNFFITEGLNIMDQTLFIKDLIVEKGVLSNNHPTEEEMQTIAYGFKIAKEIGGLDLGQTVVAKNKMIMAVETIEGTDVAIQRGCKLAKKEGIVVKVAKPNQDKRFDIPTVGLRTLKSINKFKGKILAVEANETFIVEKDEMIKYANKNNMVLIAV